MPPRVALRPYVARHAPGRSGGQPFSLTAARRRVRIRQVRHASRERSTYLSYNGVLAMKRSILRVVLGLITLASINAAAAAGDDKAAADWTAGMAEGAAEFKSMGP